MFEIICRVLEPFDLDSRGTREVAQSGSSIFAFGIPYLNQLFSNAICKRCKKGALVVESSSIDEAKLLVLKCSNCRFQLIQEVTVNEIPEDNGLNADPEDAVYLRTPTRRDTDGQVPNPNIPPFATQL